MTSVPSPGAVPFPQYYLIAPSGTLDLTVDDNHGRCNVVLVGTPMADDQLAQLREYSQTFQVGGRPRGRRGRLLQGGHGWDHEDGLHHAWEVPESINARLHHDLQQKFLVFSLTSP